jgi:hypothetical protein
MRAFTIPATLLVLAFSLPAFAATPFDVLVRLNGPVRVAGNETTQSIVVINDNAFIDGTVNGTVVVVRGRAEIQGTVKGDVIVFGDVYLASGAQVANNITVYGGAFSRGDEARVGGRIFLEQAPAIRAPGAVFVFFSIAVFALGGTLLLTLTAWRPLSNSAQLLFARPIDMLAIGTVVALSVPLAAIAILPTGVGVLLGLAILICAIPAAIFCGFTVAAIAIGDWIGLHEPNLISPVPHRRTLAEVTVGTIALLILLLVPFVGFIILLTASTMGVGALVAKAWRAWPHRGARGVAV